MMEESDFKKAWESYHDMLYRLAVTMTKNMDASMDVVQDVMLRLFRHRGSFESDEHMKAWLIRVCINRCRDLMRSPWFLKETELDPRLYACMEKNDRKILEEIMALDPESRMKNGQRSICPWTRAAWKPDKKASSILGGLPPPNPWIPCVLGSR